MKSLQLKDLHFVVFDLETTGFYADQGDQIIEIGAIRVKNLEIQEETFQSLVKPSIPIPEASTQVHGISDKDVATALPVEKVLPDFLKFCGNGHWVAQNARFDLSFVLKIMKDMQLPVRQNFAIDTMGLSKILFPYETRHNLDVMMARLGIAKTGDRHRSLDDSRYTALVLIEFIKMLESQDVNALEQIQSAFIKCDNVGKTAKPKAKSLFG